jgi:hypothetical protein
LNELWAEEGKIQKFYDLPSPNGINWQDFIMKDGTKIRIFV